VNYNTEANNEIINTLQHLTCCEPPWRHCL